MNSIQKTLRFLELAVESPKGFRLIDAAKTLHISMPAAYKYVQFFIGEGYLVKDKETQRLKTTLKVADLGLIALQNNDVIQLSDPALEELSRSRGSAAHFALRQQDQGLCVNRSGPNHSILSIAHIGMRFELYPTALGRSMLAFLPQEEMESYIDQTELTPFTDKTIYDKDDLRNELINTRKRGYSLDREEHKIGLCSMGVPFFNDKGLLFGAVSVVVPFRLTDEELQSNYRSLKEASARLTHVFGSGTLLEYIRV